MNFRPNAPVLCVALLCLLARGGSAWANDVESTAGFSDSLEVFSARTVEWLAENKTRTVGGLEGSRNAVSEHVRRWSRSLDSYFSGREDEEEQGNRSYLSLRSQLTLLKRGEHETLLRLSGRLDLPNTRDKLKLVFESEDDDLQDLDQQVLPERQRDNDLEEGSRLGLLYIGDWLGDWQPRFSTGLRLSSLDLNPYSKYELRRKDKVSTWQLGTRQEIYYYHLSGWGSKTSFELQRPVDSSSSVHLRSRAQYRNQIDEWSTLHSASLLTRLGEHSYRQYTVGMLGFNHPEEYFIALRQRKAAYKDWLFIEAYTSLGFPRDDAFRPNPAVGAGFEVLFH